ncbi:membrane protein AbrB duplication [Saccharomonospora marina XMU15]|uniref:Membrane protein AbrB duplication n=1 Tax=Saccharomonospora marina XMU15 TaxID=882083 RepID=H5X429_9PSEU|nr:AbrB family transcriptional regulator [Saccharomonospora marina]EHR53300.1 membrane protein AbrB duplication [Saccharomonospora marina XMU15]
MSGGIALVLLSGAAGAALARLLRLPFWPLIGSIAGAATARLVSGADIQLPTPWQVTAQLLAGTVVGLTIKPGVLRELRSVLLPGLVVVLGLIGFGVGWGILIGYASSTDVPTAVFGMVPGGVGEMLASATAVGADAAVVAAMHVVRLLVVLSTLPLLLRLARAFARRWGSAG